MNIKKISTLSVALVVGLAIPVALFNGETKANPTSSSLAQAEPAISPLESAEPNDSCVALQEVTTGETEIRKRIENRVIARGNWSTDFLVPSGQEINYFVAILTPEHDASYHFTPNLRMSGGTIESPFSVRSDLTRGETYSIPFQSTTGGQTAVVNARVGGVNGNFYTISVVGCQ
jgi:hypothetical protein